MAFTTARTAFPLALILIMLSTIGAAQNLAPSGGAERSTIAGGADCSDGVVQDDGTLESGYGWVPSAVDGRYIQRFELADFRSRKIEEVCICWTRNQADDSVTFNVQLYRDRGGRPAAWPEASVEAVATSVPTFPNGAFYSVDVSMVDMHATTSVFYLGVQWDPSEDGFFFVCADQTETTPVVDGWFIDDRADEWASVLDTPDPIFHLHRAMMIRAQAAEGYFPLVPTVGIRGLVILVVLISWLGMALLYYRRR